MGHARAVGGAARPDAVVVGALGASNAAVVLERLEAALRRGRAALAVSDVPHLQVGDGGGGEVPA